MPLPELPDAEQYRTEMDGPLELVAIVLDEAGDDREGRSDAALVEDLCESHRRLRAENARLWALIEKALCSRCKGDDDAAAGSEGGPIETPSGPRQAWTPGSEG